METNFTDIHQGSILEPLLFLINIKDMPDGLKSNVKLYADDTSIFSIVKNKNYSAKDLTHDLSILSKWALKRKMLLTQTLLNLHKK